MMSVCSFVCLLIFFLSLSLSFWGEGRGLNIHRVTGNVTLFLAGAKIIDVNIYCCLNCH